LIGVFDTAVCSENLGDQIIMDAVWSQLHRLLPREFFINFATHDYLGPESYKALERCALSIVGGTNLLSSNMRVPGSWETRIPVVSRLLMSKIRRVNQWKLRPSDRARLRNVVLMAVGWWQYQQAPTAYTRSLLASILHPDLPQSVRDNYTAEMLRGAGFRNAVNTGCVTMWDLTPEHMAAIPVEPAREVVMTLTFYKPDAKADERLFRMLAKQYEKVYLWVQGGQDVAYCRTIPTLKVEYLQPTLAALDAALKPGQTDYVGTRLHAGVRALQRGCRAYIVSVDNRATEIGKDTGLPVMERRDLNQLNDWIAQPYRPSLAMPFDRIEAWKSAVRAALPPA
jgi:polysaccharide pyruvyl transferase WcaK-like protein